MIARGLGAAVLLTGLAFAYGFARFVAAVDQAEAPPTRHADAIVALTGGADRIEDALKLLRDGHADRLLITGVNPATTRRDLARSVPGAHEAVECCVDLGYRAENTAGNARETADWVHARAIRSLIVVTSNYHMPRALAEMADQLPGVDLQAYPVVSDRAGSDALWTDGQRLRLLLREYSKYVVVRTRQAIAPGGDRRGDIRFAGESG